MILNRLFIEKRKKKKDIATLSRRSRRWIGWIILATLFTPLLCRHNESAQTDTLFAVVAELFDNNSKIWHLIRLIRHCACCCCRSLLYPTTRRVRKDKYRRQKGKIAAVGVNRQQDHKYLAFIRTHLWGVTLSHLKIGVISFLVPNYTCVTFPVWSSRQEKLVLHKSCAAHAEEKLIINA